MSEQDFWDIPENSNEEEEARSNLRVKIGETIIINTIWFENSSNFGEFVVLGCREGVFYNFSKRLQKQLRPFSGVGKLERPVKAKVMLSDKNQIYLTKPDPEE